MVVKVASTALKGIDAYIVEVEADVSNGLPSMSVVGLPGTAVQESKERVRTAIKNSDYAYPTKKIVINLAPADTKKEAPSLDLPIAISLLAASQQVKADELNNFVILGELSLNGEVRPIKGALCHTITAKDSGFTSIIIPEENLKEVKVVKGIKIYPVKNLKEAILAVNGETEANIFTDNNEFLDIEELENYLDFLDIKGQQSARRAIEVSAAGNHNILLVGPPGAGKTMIARRVPSILPPLSFDEALEVTKLYSICGLLNSKNGLMATRPFRSPHHSISNAGLVGGTSNPKPGEISLAHFGVLFLDELLEFKREILEVLRQPLEDKVITISRALTSITYPANFMLVAALNPCPCGYNGDTLKQCVCSQSQIDRYWNKLSGPLLDRIDIHLEIPRLNNDEIMQNKVSENSKEIRKRVVKARKKQIERYKGKNIFSNSTMEPKDLREFCQLDQDSSMLLKNAIDGLGLSARAHDRILKVARTIADLADCEKITSLHIAEAVQYRNLDRNIL